MHPVLVIAPLNGTRTRSQQRFTIWEMAADWHELMTLRRIMRPSIARSSEQFGTAVQFQSIHYSFIPSPVSYYSYR